jgi:chemotaxis protein MotA
MDFATFFGSILGFSLLIAAIVLGGQYDIFFNIPGLMIVVGGTFSAICVTFPLSDIFHAVSAVFKIFRTRKVTPNEVVNLMVKLAEISRREGLIALENIETDNNILKKICQLIADNADTDLIEETLAIEITSLRQRHFIVQEVFKKMANYAPAFGMIGTLVGLVQMLASLKDPESIGPAMAVAILTTFYGSVLSNLVFLPIAGKLKSRTIEEILHLQIIFEGAKSILQNNNPRFVYEKLSSFVPPKERKYEK